MKHRLTCTVYSAKTAHTRGAFEITDPLRVKPATMTRAQWREAVRKGRKIVKKQDRERLREEAAMPESVKLDRRLHQAGLVSPRDMGRIRQVEFKIQGV